MENQSEVDVNVLIKIYNSKLAAVSNQNVLLEAKLATLSQDFQEQQDLELVFPMLFPARVTREEPFQYLLNKNELGQYPLQILQKQRKINS